MSVTKRINYGTATVNTGLSSMFSASFTITNNQSSNAVVTGLLFDSTIRSFSAILTVSIVITNGVNLYETFTLEGTKASTGWTMCVGSSGDVTNVQFAIGNGDNGLIDGQVYYTCPDYGANFSSGTFRFSVTQIAASGTLSAVALNTVGSYSVPALQILNTTEAVSGGVNNGVLYVAGGATIDKTLNALNLNATGAVTAASAVLTSSTLANAAVTGTLTGANLAMASVTAGNLRVPGTLTVTNITVNNMVQSSGSLVANTVTTANLRVTDNFVPSSSMMFRNKIINGNFDVWQRGTSQTSSGYGSDDRWSNANNGSTKTSSRQAFTLGQTAVPGNPMYFSRTVVNSVAGADNYVIKTQAIESVTTLAGQTATLSFWAKADASKNMAVEIMQLFGNGGTPSSAVQVITTTISLTTSWTYYTVTVNIPSISGKTLGTDNKDHLLIRFWFDAGSNSAANANNLGQQSGTFDIAQVQMEQGSVATPFEQRPIGIELQLCHRYLYVIKIGQVATRVGLGFARNTTMTDILFSLPVDMRTTPIASVSSVSGWLLSDGNTTFNLTEFLLIPNVISPKNVVFDARVASGLTAFRPYFLEKHTGITPSPIVIEAEI